MFFKRERWNFHHLSEETSQNFHSIRKWIEKMEKKLSEWAEWVEILWGFMKFFFKQMLKVSVFYLEKQKKYIPKKIFFKPLSITKQKIFVYWLNFQGRFWENPQQKGDNKWRLLLTRTMDAQRSIFFIEIGRINYGAFSAKLSAPILLRWVPCPRFLLFNDYFYKKLSWANNDLRLFLANKRL